MTIKEAQLVVRPADLRPMSKKVVDGAIDKGSPLQIFKILRAAGKKVSIKKGGESSRTGRKIVIETTIKDIKDILTTIGSSKNMDQAVQMVMKKYKVPQGQAKAMVKKAIDSGVTYDKLKKMRAMHPLTKKESVDEAALKTSDYPKGTSMSAQKFKDSQKKMSKQRALTTKDYPKGTSMSATAWKNKQEEVEEKAVSKSQQKFMGMVRATQKGDMKDPSPEVAKAAKSMKKKDVKDFASTKHKGLPEMKTFREMREGAMSKDKEKHDTGGFRISNADAKAARDRLDAKRKQKAQKSASQNRSFNNVRDRMR